MLPPHQKPRSGVFKAQQWGGKATFSEDCPGLGDFRSGILRAKPWRTPRRVAPVAPSCLLETIPLPNPRIGRLEVRREPGDVEQRRARPLLFELSLQVRQA